MICECPAKPGLMSSTCCQLTHLSAHIQLPPCVQVDSGAGVWAGGASGAPKTQTHERKLCDGDHPAGIREADRERPRRL